MAGASVLGLALLTALAAVTSAGEQAARAGRRRAVPTGVIKHVVVIFQENHTFDETLGDYCILRANKCDGSIGPFTLKNGTTTSLTPSPDIINPDIPHMNAAQQTIIDGGKMDGWSDLPGCAPNGVNLCLTYFSPSQVPTLAKLADRYALSDRTFTMQNSASWGGHMYAAAASQDNFLGDIPTPAPGVTQGPGWGCDSGRMTQWIDPVTHIQSWVPGCVPAAPGTLDPVQYPYGGAYGPTPAQYIPTIFDRLDGAGLPWKLYTSIYSWAICPEFGECLYTAQRNRMVPTTNVINDARFGRLPAYSVVLPSGPNGTGQHPPSSMIVGDNWIGTVVNAIRSGPQWSSTAIFITYDDCGCFYDHVAPGTNPDGTAQGPRVPMIIVSPYAKVGYVDSTPATFASILHFTEEALGLDPLSVNDAGAYDYVNSFNFAGSARTDRVMLPQHPVPASSRRFIAHHPEILDPDDAT